MLYGQPEVMGVTFQRPVAPPPIVSGTETGKEPIQPWEIILNAQCRLFSMHPLMWDVLFVNDYTNKTGIALIYYMS